MLERCRCSWQHTSVPIEQPGWVIDNVESVLREAARYRGMPPAEKIELVASACRTAALMLEASPNRDRALAYQEPLPRSSEAALQRLMQERRARNASGPSGQR